MRDLPSLVCARPAESILAAAWTPVSEGTPSSNAPFRSSPKRKGSRRITFHERREPLGTGEAGLEPATPRFGDACSAKLSYSPLTDS
jgi:hypothetical protein